MKFFAFTALSFLFLMTGNVMGAQESEKKPRVINYTYERPTIEKLTRLFWTLSRFDLKDDAAVDFYMMVNECDLFREYYHNELEWKNIRESGRSYLEKNKNRFSLRFEIMQPLKLGEYHIETSSFDIPEEYQIKGMRSFEILAENYDSKICGYANINDNEIIGNYPAGIVAEFSRPITLTSLKTDPEKAKKYLAERLKEFKDLRPHEQTSENLHNLRDAYIVIKMKFFSYEGDVRTEQSSSQLSAKVLGILEGMEIYADNKKKDLLFSEDYRRKKNREKINVNAKETGDLKPMLLDSDADVSALGAPVKN